MISQAWSAGFVGVVLGAAGALAWAKWIGDRNVRKSFAMMFGFMFGQTAEALAVAGDDRIAHALAAGFARAHGGLHAQNGRLLRLLLAASLLNQRRRDARPNVTDLGGIAVRSLMHEAVVSSGNRLADLAVAAGESGSTDVLDTACAEADAQAIAEAQWSCEAQAVRLLSTALSAPSPRG